MSNPKNKLTIAYMWNGEECQFACTVDAFSDLSNATRALQLQLIEQALSVQPWVVTRENVRP